MSVKLTFFSPIHSKHQPGKLCRPVSEFDALCEYDDLVIILSANPCSDQKHSVGLTIASKANASILDHTVITDVINC